MTDGPPPRSGRRSAAIIVVLLLAAAVCWWASSRMTWVQVTSFDGLGEQRTADLLGGTWAAALTPLALTLIAAIAASFAVRGWALRVLGVLLAAVAVAAALPAADLLFAGVTEERVAQLAELPARADVLEIGLAKLPAILVLFGAVLALGAAVTLLRRPTAGAGLSSKYERPAVGRDAHTKTSAASEPATQRMLWDALDAGEDPTADDSDGDGVEEFDGPADEPGPESNPDHHAN